MFIPTIDIDSEQTLFRQIHSQISRAILTGTIKPGEKLPSSRELAAQCGISRTISIAVYDQLIAEGFAYTHPGKGTFAEEKINPLPQKSSSPLLLEKVGFGPLEKNIIDFRSGLPDLKAFPLNDWKSCIHKTISSYTERDLAYSAPEGVDELRKQISCYLHRMRNMEIPPESLVICSGTTQAINIISALLINGTKKTVIMEDPVTYDVPEIIKQKKGIPLFIPVDNYGIRSDMIPGKKSTAFCYITPSHQYPLGGILPVSRRTELIEKAEINDFYIAEDDYDSEFRYEGPPLSPCYSLHPERVIYIGTFSKTLSPGIRIAYLVLPEKLLNRCRRAKWSTDLHNPVLEQKALALFLERGDYYRHLSRMKKRYKHKREEIIKLLAKYLKKEYRILGTEAGLHLVLQFPELRMNETQLKQAELKGIKLYPVSRHIHQRDDFYDSLIMGYSHLSQEEMEQGITTLSEIMS